jgi:hypothetical protein
MRHLLFGFGRRSLALETPFGHNDCPPVDAADMHTTVEE